MAIGFTGVKLHVKRKLRKTLLLCCAAHWCAAILGLYAMQRLVLGNALVILYTSPLLTFFLVGSGCRLAGWCGCLTPSPSA